MTTLLASKSDLALLRQDINSQLTSLRQDMTSNQRSLKQELELLRSSMTIRLGSMMVVLMSLLFAALKLT